MAGFNRGIRSPIGVAEPHQVVADVSGKVIWVLDRKSEDVAFRSYVGPNCLLHLGKFFTWFCYVEGGQHTNVQVLKTLAHTLCTSSDVAQGVFEQAVPYGAEQDHAIADFP